MIIFQIHPIEWSVMWNMQLILKKWLKYFPSIFKHLWWHGLSRHASRKTQICGTHEKSEIISSSRSKSVDRNEWISGGDDATRWSCFLFMFAPIPIVKIVISFLDWVHNYNWESWIFNSYPRILFKYRAKIMTWHWFIGWSTESKSFFASSASKSREFPCSRPSVIKITTCIAAWLWRIFN